MASLSGYGMGANRRGPELIWEVAERVSSASEDLGREIEVLYILGEVRGDSGTDAVSISLMAATRRVFLVEDGLGASWVVYHEEGSAGTARKCTASHAGDLADDCCSFLGLSDR